jgi:hypothetical protein
MQQINLYQAEFKPKVVILTSWQILLVSLLLIFIILVSSFFSSQHFNELDAQFSLKQQHLNTQKQQANDLKQEMLQYGEQPLLNAKLVSLQKQLKQQEAILSHLTNDNSGPQPGFSPTLTSLSQQHIDNVWLTSFSLRHGGSSITIQGRSSQPSLIPEYIDSLAKSSTFSGQQFSVFQMSSPDENTDTYDFELHSQESDNNQ